MKRTNEKIKDFVEPQAFDAVRNYADNPARSLAAYRFTDATSLLLARWLDALADLPRGRGTARALAGLRGVGKSHTLSAFAAICAHTELRSELPDAHVATSARRLLNRQYTVVRVERGTRETLMQEVGAALVRAFGGAEADWLGVEPEQMLTVAASRAGDNTLVLLVDTAFGREARVRRDDGPALSRLAAATESAPVFIALALDDDIETAEGVNAVLAGTYRIDYLDPEHLYRIADIHLFQKNANARAALHEIYNSLRASVQGFNWSEPRFTAIYPVHPLVADIAPAVRLYAPQFAFLPFAAESVERAANRPALSLVVLDEVFDRTEAELREATDLEEAFTTYDRLATQGITEIPIMQRLQAKLLLKGLFILSLDGRGATARELGAAMLIYDDADPEAGVRRIEEMLARFVQLAPEGSLKRSDEAEARYRFNIRTSDAFDEALAQSVERLAPDGAAVNALLRALARTRFEDWPFAEDGDGEEVYETAFTIMWRGVGRTGRVGWQPPRARADAPSSSDEAQADSSFYDWSMRVLVPEGAGSGAEMLPDGGTTPPIKVTWRPSELKPEELESLHRLIALRTDAGLMTEFGEAARAAERTQTGIAERIWARLYLDDGALLTETGARPFTSEARSGRTLASVLGQMLHISFGARYPQHPVFMEAFGEAEVARLVGGFFGGASHTDAGVQELARRFCAPLGLVSQRGDALILEAGDAALKQPWIREVLRLTDEADGQTVPLEEVYSKLKGEPYGLQREAQHLILAALVAQRRIELVTGTGDRIGRRTLDLKLRWEEVSGVARAAALLHTAEELTAWARRLSNATELASIADPLAREAVRAALEGWLEGWRARRILEKFDALPEEGLTTRAWNLASSVRKTFGVAAESVEAALDNSISLEEGLQRVADAFADSPDNFQKSLEHLSALTGFTNGLAERVRAHDYLLLTEPTDRNEIESARRELLRVAEDVHSLFDHDSAARFDLLWREFQARYAEHYGKVHDETVGAYMDRRALDEFFRSDEWREFEALSGLSILGPRFRDEVLQLSERARNHRCTLPVRQLLTERPFCGCSFRLSRAGAIRNLPLHLRERVEFARRSARRTLSLISAPLAAALEHLAQALNEEEVETRERALSLSEAFNSGRLPEKFSLADTELIERVLRDMGSLPPVRVRVPLESLGLAAREDLRAHLNQWLDELPCEPALVEVFGD